MTSDDYLPGSIVLAHSLRAHGWKHPTVAVVTAGVTQPIREKLASWWDRVVEVEGIPNPHPKEEQWFHYFGDMYSKLRIWSMTEYDRIVYLDSDILVTGSVEELLDRPRFAAAPCTTPADTFNGGVLVLDPDLEVYQDMLSKVGKIPSHDGSDQGFLNTYYSDWFTGPAEHRLPIKFNVPQTLFLSGMGWKRVLPDMRVLHFVSPAKPWKRRAARFGRFGYRAMSRWANAAGGTTPTEMWLQGWEAATGSSKPPWKGVP